MHARACCSASGLPDDIKLAVGVERLDYTKGILDRFHAWTNSSISIPTGSAAWSSCRWRRRAASNLPAYQQLHQECLDLVADINERYGSEGYQPIILLDEHHDQEQLFELYRAADLCVVSSLHDGMNLVAKEFVAARDDEQGVLVLSAFAGASRELLEALIVNPVRSQRDGRGASSRR